MVCQYACEVVRELCVQVSHNQLVSTWSTGIYITTVPVYHSIHPTIAKALEFSLMLTLDNFNSSPSIPNVFEFEVATIL